MKAHGFTVRIRKARQLVSNGGPIYFVEKYLEPSKDGESRVFVDIGAISLVSSGWIFTAFYIDPANPRPALRTLWSLSDKAKQQIDRKLFRLNEKA